MSDYIGNYSAVYGCKARTSGSLGRLPRRSISEWDFANLGEIAMPQPERIETLVLGSGNGGMYLAWHMARSRRRTAVVERRWIGGSCPNINCLPSKNEIWSAKVADLVHHGASFGAKTDVS
jgi:hypothetical protein